MTEPETEFTAVLDRFEDDQVVLLLEEDGEVVDEFVVAVDDLPEDARHQDAVLTVSVVHSRELVDVQYEPAETESRTTAAQDWFDRLSQRPPSESDESDVPDDSI